MKTLRFAMSLAFIAGLTVIHANAQTAEETLAKIEKDFAAVQITKNPKAFEAIAEARRDSPQIEFCQHGHHKLSSKPTAALTHLRSGLVQRKSLLGSGAPRASEADGLRSDLVIDLTALADNPHPASISLFKHIEPRVRAAEFLPIYALQRRTKPHSVHGG